MNAPTTPRHVAIGEGERVGACLSMLLLALEPRKTEKMKTDSEENEERGTPPIHVDTCVRLLREESGADRSRCE